MLDFRDRFQRHCSTTVKYLKKQIYERRINMNKQQLIEAIANEVEVTKATAAGCLDAFMNTVTKVLKKKAGNQ